MRPEHRPAVEDELARLAASLASNWAGSPDLDRARAADRLGIGGPPVTRLEAPADSR